MDRDVIEQEHLHIFHSLKPSAIEMRADILEEEEVEEDEEEVEEEDNQQYGVGFAEE
jgi:3-dehydroquinate dehydratase